MERIKAAREEAALEVEKVKQAKQAEYFAYERSILGSLDAMMAECAQRTEKELEGMRLAALEKVSSAAQLLIDRVLMTEN